MATNKPQDDYQKQGVRIPRELHARLHEAAAAAGRSYNSELIARLEQSFESADPGELKALREELEQQRQLAQNFKAVGDYISGVRSLVAGQLLDTLGMMRADQWPKGIDTAAAFRFAEWIAQKSDRGTAAMLLKLIDGADPNVIAVLREVASQEDRLSERLAQVRRMAESFAARHYYEVNKPAPEPKPSLNAKAKARVRKR